MAKIDYDQLGKVYEAAKIMAKTVKKESDLCSVTGAKQRIWKILNKTNQTQEEKDAEMNALIEEMIDACETGAAKGVIYSIMHPKI